MIMAYSEVTKSSWKTASGSVVGKKNATRGIACQDSVAIELGKESLAVCVCDGAGSARFSDLGAKAVATKVAQFLIRHADKAEIDHLSPGAILHTARVAISSEVHHHGGTPGDYACTLLALLLVDKQAITFHLGDGLMVVVESGLPKVLSSPDNDEYVNQTVFVTSSGASNRMRMGTYSVGSLVTSFAVMSDGTQASLYNRKTNSVSQVVEQLASWLDEGTVQEVEEELDSAIKQYFLPRTQDDCTVVVIRRTVEQNLHSCPTCQRWDCCKGYGEKKNYCLRCEICGHTVQINGNSQTGYPKAVKKWVEYLFAGKNLQLKRVHEITGIPTSTLRRWFKDYLKIITGETG